MPINIREDGKVDVDIRIRDPHGKRIRRRFSDLDDALAFQDSLTQVLNERYASHSSDRRCLTALLDLWWDYYGQSHKNGMKERNHLIKTINILKDIPVKNLGKRELMNYRTARLKEGIKASTINRDIYRLAGMFSKLIKLELYRDGNPVHGLPPLVEEIPGMTFLSTQEIKQLLGSLTGDERLVALICLSTGGRWSEVASLTPPQLMNCRITFLKTKNGKKRTVPISPRLDKEIKSKAIGCLFDVNYGRFCRTLKSIKADLPAGQATHILRHTFASHFMMNGGNIIALQQILGHASIQQTMSYAHMSPDYLQHAISLNPLRGGVNP